MREGEIKEEGEQTQVGELLGDFQRGHFKLLHPRTGMGGKGQEGQAIHLSLQFSFFCLSFIRIGPMLLLSSVALTLWAAMGWGGGGQGFTDCSATREKLEWSPPFQSVLCIGVSRSVMTMGVKCPIALWSQQWHAKWPLEEYMRQGDLVSDPIFVLILLFEIDTEFLNMHPLLGNDITFFKWDVCNYFTKNSPLPLGVGKNKPFFSFSPSHPFHSFIHLFIHLFYYSFSKYLLGSLFVPDTVPGTGDTELLSWSISSFGSSHKM